MQRVWPRTGFKPAVSSFPKAVILDTCIIQDTNESADLTSAQFQKMKKTPTTKLNFFPSEVPFRPKKLTDPSPSRTKHEFLFVFLAQSYFHLPKRTIRNAISCKILLQQTLKVQGSTQ